MRVNVLKEQKPLPLKDILTKPGIYQCNGSPKSYIIVVATEENDLRAPLYFDAESNLLEPVIVEDWSGHARFIRLKDATLNFSIG